MDWIFDLWGIFLLLIAFTALFAFLVTAWMMALQWIMGEYSSHRMIKQQRKARAKSEDLFVKVEKFQNDFK